MRRAATIGLAMLGSAGAALLLYGALANFLTVGPAYVGRLPASAAIEYGNQEGSSAVGEPSTSEPRNLEEKR